MPKVGGWGHAFECPFKLTQDGVNVDQPFADRGDVDGRFALFRQVKAELFQLGGDIVREAAAEGGDSGVSANDWVFGRGALSKKCSQKSGRF
jgi:hypothetical protein